MHLVVGSMCSVRFSALADILYLLWCKNAVHMFAIRTFTTQISDSAGPMNGSHGWTFWFEPPTCIIICSYVFPVWQFSQPIALFEISNFKFLTIVSPD